MKRQHPIAILRYTSRNFWLLIIPLIRGLRFYGYDFYGWIRGAYIDIIVVIVIFTAAFLRWYNIKYSISKKGIKFKKGIFFKSRSFISFSALSVVKYGEYLHLKPFKAVVINFNTDINKTWNNNSECDVKLIVYVTEWKRILNKITIDKSDTEYIYKPSRKSLMLFALYFSSTFSGLIFFSALILNGGKLVAEEIENRFVSAVNNITMIAEKIISGLSPFSVAVVIIIAGGWLISFIKNYVRHINFKTERCKKSFIVENGFFSRRRYFINIEKINCIDLRQNLLMKIFKLMSVHVSSIGYGRGNEIPLVIPVTHKKDIVSNMKILLPEITVNETEIHPHRKYLMSFVFLPTVFIYTVIAASLIVTMFFPEWYKVIFFASAMTEIFLLYFYFARLAEYFTNGIGFNRKILTMKYRKFFQFHYIMIPYDKITAVMIKQNVIQKRKTMCDFIVYERNKTIGAHKVKNVNITELIRMMKNTGILL